MTRTDQSESADRPDRTEIGELGEVQCTADPDSAKTWEAQDEYVTEQQRTQKELAEYACVLESSNKALEEFYQVADAANRAKSRFLENMSHELRTPLHAILSFASFGIKQIETAGRDDLLRYFRKIDRSGKVLLTLVNDLLDLAKLEAGETCFEFGPTDLGRSHLRDPAESKNCRVSNTGIAEWMIES